jgi:hypothetical protein
MQTLQPQIDYIKTHVESSNEQYQQRFEGVSIEQIANQEGVAERLYHTILRSIAMENQTALQKQHPERLPFSFTPITFVRKKLAAKAARGLIQSDSVTVDLQLDVQSGAQHLYECLISSGSSPGLPDIFAQYFCDTQEVTEAKNQAKNKEYFSSDSHQGYGQFLPPVKQQLIQRALAYYHLVDFDGNIIEK